MNGAVKVLLVAVLGVPLLITLWAMADGDGQGGRARSSRQRLARAGLVVVSLAVIFGVFVSISVLLMHDSE